MRRIALATAWFLASAVLAALSLRDWLGDELFVTRYTGYVMPWLLLGLLPGAVWAWMIRRRVLSAVLGMSAAIIAAEEAPLFRGHDPISSPPAVRLEVMSYNTWSGNKDEGRIADVVLREAPDILLIQEIRPEVFGRLMDELRDLYGGRGVYRAYDAALLQAVISRYPVEPRASMKDKGQAQKVVVHTPAGPISVYNVHPLRQHGGWRHRYGEIASLLEEDVLRERSLVILGGDFNTTDQSQLYRLIAGHLRNAHREAGFGFGFTYPASGFRVLRRFTLPSVVRIDHIFFSDHFVALRAGTLREDGGSDHRPVFAELGLRSSTPDDAPGRVSGSGLELGRW